MARPKSEGETKTHQQHVLMAPSEVAAIDDWGFRHRIRSRGEAIRRLCQIGIAADAAISEVAGEMETVGADMQAMQDVLDRHLAPLDEAACDEVIDAVSRVLRRAFLAAAALGDVEAAMGEFGDGRQSIETADRRATRGGKSLREAILSMVDDPDK